MQSLKRETVAGKVSTHSLYKGRKRAQNEEGIKLPSCGVVSRASVKTKGPWAPWQGGKLSLFTLFATSL